MEKELQPVSALDASDRSASLAPGAILQNRYAILRQLGKGGMGAVYAAIDQRLAATVAIKETFSVEPRLRRQFEQEACLLAQLHHPALPKVSDYFTEGDRAFLVMEFISGSDLAQIIAQQPGPFPRNRVVAWADQLLDALIYLHTRDRQVIHRDIKPHNLKLTASGQIALLDFGLAKAESADASAADSSISIFGYTRRYAPLEQIQDQGTTPQSDIYALGATLYHLLTGVKPADALARAAALVNSKPDPLRPANDIHPAVGPEIAAILCRAMAQNPEERYASASDFRQALWRVGRDEVRIAEGATHVAAASSASALAAGTALSRTIVRTANTHAVDPFDGYFILKPKEPEWFQPAEKQGPRVMAGIVLLLLIAGAGTLYGYRHLIASSNSALNSARSTAAELISDPKPVPQHKTDKPRSSVTSNTGGTLISAGNLNQKINANEQSQASERQTVRVTGASSATPANSPLIERTPRSALSRQITVPNPRLPNTVLKEINPSLSLQRIPAFGQPDVVSERQVLRAPDGTQVVKFSDGTTKVFRPGEKIVQSGVAPK